MPLYLYMNMLCTSYEVKKVGRIIGWLPNKHEYKYGKIEYGTDDETRNSANILNQNTIKYTSYKYI